MAWLVLIGVFFIGFGIVSLLFPDLTRGMDRFSNQLEGVKTEQGQAYEFSRVMRGVMFIIAGIVILSMPAWF